MNKLVEIEKQELRSDLTQFGPGDTVKVFFRIHEGKKEKVQAFQGICIKMKGSGSNRSFTLRKISQGVGIERIFPLHSPVIDKIEVVRYGKVRRAKLYYLREKVGKKRQVKERILSKKEKAAKKTTKVEDRETKQAAEVPAEEPQLETPSDEPAIKDPAKEDQNGKPVSGPRGVEEG
ncbi:50S ribosomal protein L19 [candidate division WOR-3 bacterium]|nr:50S ribosomal protein L19 [candidate division WOR-3 bacterium]